VSHTQPWPRADSLEAIARTVAETEGMLATVHKLVATAVATVPCDWAAVAITDELTDRPARLAASNDAALAAEVAAIAVSAGNSPGITAFTRGHVVGCPDLAADASHCGYAREMLTRTPVRSVLAVPLLVDGTPIGVITLYAAEPCAFDDAAVVRAGVLADHAAIAVEAALLQDGAADLPVALLQSRLLGQAQGVLIERPGISATVAFQRLCEVSRRTNRSISDVAAELVSTGSAEDL
jgi:GAF domain-containing protein